MFKEIIKNQIKLRKLQASKQRGLRTQINKPPNPTKASSRTLKIFFVCCSVAIKDLIKLYKQNTYSQTSRIEDLVKVDNQNHQSQTCNFLNSISFLKIFSASDTPIERVQFLLGLQKQQRPPMDLACPGRLCGWSLAGLP